MNKKDNNWSSHVPKRNQQPFHNKDQNNLNIPASPKKARPFYKKWWFWLTSFIIIFAIATLVFWILNQQSSSPQTNQTTDKKSETSQKTSPKTNSQRSKSHSTRKKVKKSTSSSIKTSSPKSKNNSQSKSGNTAIGKTGTALEIFNQIKLGDTANNGTGGDLESDLIKKLNSPHKIEELVFQGKKAHRDIWGEVIGITKGSGNVVIFVKDGKNFRAVSKTSVGISNDIKKDKLTLAQFNQLKTQGLTTEKAIKILGQPNAMTESHLSGNIYISYTWDTNLQGRNDAYVTINFTNNEATTKIQDGLK